MSVQVLIAQTSRIMEHKSMPEVLPGALAIVPGHSGQPPPSAQQLATGRAASPPRPSPFH